MMKELELLSDSLGALVGGKTSKLGCSSPCARRIERLLVILLFFAAGFSAFAQAPGLEWSTNVGATLFATDTNGNVYGYTNGAVEILNASGALVQSNTVCPVPGLAQRDATGNYYFAGAFSGTQNFGGITLVGGFGSPPDPRFPTCYLAKYDSGGNLLWVIPFGVYGQMNHVDDMALNGDGSVTIGFDYSGNPSLTQFSSLGTNTWQTNFPVFPMAGALKVNGIVGGNGCYILYNSSGGISGGFYNSTGQLTAVLASGSPPFPNWKNSLSLNVKPVPGTNNDIYVAALGLTPPSTNVPVLQDYQSGQVLLSSQSIGSIEQWAVAGDGQGRVFVAGIDGTFSEYLGSGSSVWSTNYGAPVSTMLFDSQGNRYISMTNGTIAKLQSDAPAAPVITNAPIGGTIFAGSNFTFTVGASGFGPLGYQWLYQSNSMALAAPIAGATNTILALSNAVPAQSGLYSVAISNVVNSVTSTPVTLSVKQVEIFSGSQMLSAGSYSFPAPPTLTVASAYTNGEIFYTLDGSTPSFLSTPYSGPFVLTNSATVNAIGYSADFAQSAFADTVIATVPPQFTLSVSTPGGGSITVNPPGGSFTNVVESYGSNSLVTVTAAPATGYLFMGWQGASSSISPTISVNMNQNQTLTAVFGTTLSTTVSGNGQVFLDPPGGLYAFGSVVAVEALPQPGNLFGVWGNAASGSANPLYFTVTNPNPTISSVFGSLPSTESALTVLILGQGKVGASPSGNFIATNQSVVLTATPNAGQTFLRWGGDISSTQNPVTITMSNSYVIKAEFSGQTLMLRPLGMTPQGFQLAPFGDPGSVVQIQFSTDLIHWTNLLLMTNTTGQTPFIDTSSTNSKSTFYRGYLVMP